MSQGSRATAPRDRLAVASRIVAAMAGSYAVAALAAVALGTALPLDPAAASIWATLIGLLLMPVAAMICFRVRSAARAWAILLAAAILCGGIAFASGWRP